MNTHSSRYAIALVGLVGLAFSAVSSAPCPARAEPKKKGAQTAPAINLSGLTAKLKSADLGEIQAGLEEASTAGRDAAPLAPLVEDLLRKGASAEIDTAALRALGAMAVEKSSVVIRPYARHRRVELRRSAVKALLRTGGAEAVSALREGLSDADAIVRGTSASGLGALKAREAMSDLFLALDHKVDEAAASLGQLCTVEECEKFAGKMGIIGFDVMTSGFDQILFRPGSDITDDEKVRIVGRLRELGTGEANKYLRDVQSRWPAGSSPRVKQAIDQAVLATAGGAGSGGAGSSVGGPS